MIKSIYLENWKTHLKSKLDFKKGSNIIIGIIGSGKSSIVDAICYGLYGTFPTLSNRKVTLDETIMFKPIKKDFFKIILEIEQEDKTYVIEREVFTGNKANSAKIYVDNKLIAGPKKTDVDEYISKLLGIDYNLFIKVVYSQQNEIDYFLKIAPSKRKEQFDDLFGISHFENIKISTREIERGLSFEKSKKESLINQINTQIENVNFSEILEKEKDVKEKVQVTENQISNLEIKIKESFEKLLALKETKERHDKLNFENKILESKINDLEKESLEINFSNEQLEKLKKDILIFEKELKEKQLENNRILVLKKDFENKASFLEKELLENKKKLENLSLQIKKEDFTISDIIAKKEDFTRKIDSLKNEKVKLFLQIKDLEKSLQELSKDHSKCPVCDAPFSQDKLIFLKDSKNKELLEKKKQQVENTESVLQFEKQLKEILECEKTSEKNTILKEQIKDVSKKILTIEENLLKIKEDTLKITLPVDLSLKEKELNLLKQDLFKKEEFLKNKIKLEDYKQKKEIILNDLEKIIFSEEEYLEINSEYKNNTSSLKDLKDKLLLFKDITQTITKQIENYASLQKEKENIEKNLTQIDLNKQDLSYFQKSIDLSQAQLRKVLIDNINQALSLIWPKIYPYKDYLSARLNSNNDYILEVLTQRNEWIRVEGLLSGGERACASLSIRIAISLILTKKLGLLILDEPTHNLDDFSIEALSNVIDTEMPDLVEQIFIVTHDKKLLEAINANKFIVNRDKENDSFSELSF